MNKIRNYEKWKKIGKILTIIFIVLLCIAIVWFVFCGSDVFSFTYGFYRTSEGGNFEVVAFLLGFPPMVLILVGLIVASIFWGIGSKHTKKPKTN